jgi:hypothetical protein
VTKRADGIRHVVERRLQLIRRGAAAALRVQVADPESQDPNRKADGDNPHQLVPDRH